MHIYILCWYYKCWSSLAFVNRNHSGMMIQYCIKTAGLDCELSYTVHWVCWRTADIQICVCYKLWRQQLANADTEVKCWCRVSAEKSSGELRVGDRIIEVNGEPVQDQSLAEVWVVNTLSHPDTLLLRLSVSHCIYLDHGTFSLFICLLFSPHDAAVVLSFFFLLLKWCLISDVTDRGAPDPDPDPAGYLVDLVDPVQIRIRPDPR